MRSVLRKGRHDLAYHLWGLVTTTLAFAVVVAAVSVALPCALLIIGLPVALAAFAVLRWTARLERRRNGWALGRRIGEAYRPREGGWLKRIQAVLGDPQSWKDLTWLAFAGTVGWCAAVVAVVLWGTVLGTVLLPAWYWSLPEPVDFLVFEVDSVGTAFIATGLALAAIPLVYGIERVTTEGLARLGAALLAPSAEAALRRRVDELAATRAGAVDAAATELQRIERDLHDGAQARLVALAMDLGLAEERFARDPDSAIELVGEAREEAKRALAELRDLARGIRPSLLAERGLGPALTALAARSPVPAGVELDVPERLPAGVENAAWFVVSEALANAGKHSGAQRVLVRVAPADGRLLVEVSDDGRGGADPNGDGLTGLRRRVEALDGRLAVASPAGGPTTVRAELPCAS